MTLGSLTLKSGGWSKSLPTNFLRSKVGIGLVQPGRKRRFVIPVELPKGISKVQASWQPPKKG